MRRLVAELPFKLSAVVIVKLDDNIKESVLFVSPVLVKVPMEAVAPGLKVDAPELIISTVKKVLLFPVNVFVPALLIVIFLLLESQVTAAATVKLEPDVLRSSAN